MSVLESAATRSSSRKVVPARHPWRWVGAGLAAAAAFLIIRAFVTSPSIQWDAVAEYLAAPRILDGLWLTIVLTVVAQSVGIVGGVLLAVMRLSPNPVFVAISSFYVWIFRGTPTLIQIILWFNLALIVPTLGIDLPLLGIDWSVQTNVLVTPFVAAVLGLGLNEAAYMAEIVRGGISSVDQGQSEAAASIGMSRAKTMLHIVLPQAVRAIIPPTGNELISMLKSTSLVSVIAARELLTSAQQIYAANFLTIELLLVASVWYLVLTTVASIGQGFIEYRFDVSLRTRKVPLLLRLWRRLRADRSKGGAL